MNWIWPSTKIVLFGGAAYNLTKADIWGDNESSINYLNKQCESCDKIKYYKKMIPSCEEVRIQCADSWNNGVRFVFDSIDKLPENTVNGACWISTQLQELSKLQEVSKPSAPPTEVQKTN